MLPNEKMVSQFIAAKIKTKRQENQVSQIKLAKLLGVSFQQIQKYERGLNKISITRLHQLSKIFSCSIMEFFPNNEEEFAVYTAAPPDQMWKIVNAGKALLAVNNAEVRECILKLAHLLTRKRGGEEHNHVN